MILIWYKIIDKIWLLSLFKLVLDENSKYSAFKAYPSKDALPSFRQYFLFWDH